MQFIFVEFLVALEIILYDVSRGHFHFVFGIEVEQTESTFQFKKNFFSEKSCILRQRIDNASVAFLKSVSIFRIAFEYIKSLYLKAIPPV